MCVCVCVCERERERERVSERVGLFVCDASNHIVFDGCIHSGCILPYKLCLLY